MSAHERLKIEVGTLAKLVNDHSYILQRQIHGNQNADATFRDIDARLNAIEARIEALEPQPVDTVPV